MSKEYMFLEEKSGKRKGKSGWGLSFLLRTLVAVILLGVSSMGGNCFAAPQVPARPAQDIYVVDQAKMITGPDKQQMLALGHDMNQRFGAQLVVVTTDTLNGEDLREYTNQLFRAWGIGSKEKNNGVLLFIAKNDRKFRIEVGYGLEGAITDGYASSVLRDMKPGFKKNEYSPAILAAYGKLAGKIYAEYGAEPPVALADLHSQKGQQENSEPAAEDDDELDFLTVVGIIIMLLIAFAVLWFINYMIGGLFYLLGSGGPGGPGSSSGSDGGFGDFDCFGGGDSGGGGADDGW